MGIYSIVGIAFFVFLGLSFGCGVFSPLYKGGVISPRVFHLNYCF